MPEDASVNVESERHTPDRLLAHIEEIAQDPHTKEWFDKGGDELMLYDHTSDSGFDGQDRFVIRLARKSNGNDTLIISSGGFSGNKQFAGSDGVELENGQIPDDKRAELLTSDAFRILSEHISDLSELRSNYDSQISKTPFASLSEDEQDQADALYFQFSMMEGRVNHAEDKSHRMGAQKLLDTIRALQQDQIDFRRIVEHKNFLFVDKFGSIDAQRIDEFPQRVADAIQQLQSALAKVTALQESQTDQSERTSADRIFRDHESPNKQPPDVQRPNQGFFGRVLKAIRGRN